MCNIKIISVIICTYNRCESLKDTLDSLLLQDSRASLDYEVIIVDNNSKDKTKEIVESYSRKFKGKLKYVFETKQGLSYARNKGIQESKGEIIAFTDDDVIVGKKWLTCIYECFNTYHYKAIGGRVLPVYPKNTPKWIVHNQNELNGPIPMYDYGEENKLYKRVEMLPFIGANMAFRRDCFREIGFFNENLGAGTGKMGEDTEYFRRLEKKSKNLYYCGSALVWHKLENNRMNLKYIAKWCIQSGKYSVTIEQRDFKEKLISYFGIPRYLIRSVSKNVILLVIFIFNKKKLIKHLIKIFREIGMMQEYRQLYICQK